MSAETFTTAMFLITAVIAAGVLINAVFPVVYQMAGTFSSSTHASDVRLRTDFTIVTTFAIGTPKLSGQIFMKNIGTQSVSIDEIKRSSDVFFGPVGNVQRLSYSSSASQGSGSWTYVLYEPNGKENNFWDPGETLEIDAFSTIGSSTSGDPVTFQFILPNGVWRSSQFTVG
jgi:archaeal flagellar protein FlaG